MQHCQNIIQRGATMSNRKKIPKPAEDEIIQALGNWVKEHPDAEKPILFVTDGKGKGYSPKQILDEIKRGTEFGKMQKEEIIKMAADLIYPPKDSEPEEK